MSSDLKARLGHVSVYIIGENFRPVWWFQSRKPSAQQYRIIIALYILLVVWPPSTDLAFSRTKFACTLNILYTQVSQPIKLCPLREQATFQN